MTYRGAWFADCLRAGGASVLEVDSSWKSRGHGDMAGFFGILLHHTADGPPPAPMPSYLELVRGRPDLAGPIANLGLGRDGVWRPVAAGKAWHAGPADGGSYQELHNGNSFLIGVEIENTGYLKGPRAEQWSELVLDACATGCAAMLKKLNLPVSRVWAHKEWAPSRKVDPTFDMGAMRERIAAKLQSVAAYTPERPPAPNAKLAWDTMMLEGYRPEQAAGWIGNAQQESYEDLRTTVAGDHGEAIGIFQWHGPRQVWLHRYADDQHKPWDDLVTQLRFSLTEPGEGKAHAALQAAHTVDEAVEAGLLYTRPGRPNRPRRLALAHALYKWFVPEEDAA